MNGAGMRLTIQFAAESEDPTATRSERPSSTVRRPAATTTRSHGRTLLGMSPNCSLMIATQSWELGCMAAERSGRVALGVSEARLEKMRI